MAAAPLQLVMEPLHGPGPLPLEVARTLQQGPGGGALGGGEGGVTHDSVVKNGSRVCGVTLPARRGPPAS